MGRSDCIKANKGKFHCAHGLGQILKNHSTLYQPVCESLARISSFRYLSASDAALLN